MADTIDETPRRVRKRRRNRQTGLQLPAVQQRVFWAVAVLAVVVAAYSLHKLRLAGFMFGATYAGMNHEEMIYLRGQPVSKTSDGRVWHYQASSGVTDFVRFGEDGRAKAISCIAVAPGAFGCPDIMGVGLGSTEDYLINRLGPPTSETYVRGGKVMGYSDLGLVFTMREWRIAGITKTERSSRFGYVPRLAWFLMP